MTQTPRLKPGTQRLSESARHVILPTGIVSTAWPAVEHRCNRLGIAFDEWQRGAGRALLALNKDGHYAADTAALSIPRQVGKTFLLGAIVFALCMIHPRMTVLWSAHHSRTSDETFKVMQGMARLPKIAPHIKAVRVAADGKGITFSNGSRILFGAREHGFGRGWSGVDVLVFDEAQILSSRAMDDMLPTTNQASTGNPLVLMAGTPPRPGIDDGDAFSRLRAEAIEAGSGSGETLYIEFSADPDSEPSDRDQWAKANPSYPHRTPVRAMQRMLKRLGIASFRREALGIWDDAALDQSVIDADKFAALKADVQLDGSPSFGIRFSADGARMAMAIAVPTSTGKAFVEVLDSASTSVGLASVTAWLAQCWRDADAIVIDGKAMAGLLTEELRTAGVPARKIIRPSSDDVGTASARLVALVKAEQIAHAGQPGLVYTAGRAARRPIGVQGLWGFRALNADADVDIPALEAVALAISGLKERPNSAGTQSDDNQRSRSRGGRKATVM